MAPKTIPTFLGTILLLLVLMLSLVTIQSKPTKRNAFEFLQHLQGCHRGQNVTGLHDLKRYLEKFGDFHSSNPHSNDDEFDDFLESAIKTYQQNYHLKVTGSLDSDTVKHMIMPRCGVPDYINGTSTSRHHHGHHHNRKLIHSVSHYSFFEGAPRWTKSHLTYYFRTNSHLPTIRNIKSICARAFKKWAQVSHFTFEEVPESSLADIRIGFHSGEHGDGNPFDGPSGTLAHAFSPTNGRLHFDADEDWSSNPEESQFDFETVALHEIGHILGLGHEPSIPDAIMYPSVTRGLTKRNLHADDIQGIRALYGSN
ncbi:hypothetical protein UlMin_026090 [Ulmus minor]